MRKRRAWSTLDEDAESQESAAFEASVAAAKDTAAKSGAFLSSVKEDLSDHKRWLRAQSAAVEKDRQRHERWVERQRDRRLANAKKERISRHRRVMRARALNATRQSISDLVLFVRSWIAFVFGKLGEGLRRAEGSIGRGISFVARKVGRGCSSVGRKIANGFAFVGHQIAQGVRWTGALLGVAESGAGKSVSAGASWSGAKAIAWARAGRHALASGSSAAASETRKLSRMAGEAIGGGLSATGSKATELASATGRGVAGGASRATAKAYIIGTTGKQGLARAYAWTKSRAAAISPQVYMRVAKLGRCVQSFARARTAAPSLSLAARDLPSEHAVRPHAGELQVASVHVIEVYGPHKDGAELYGKPANEPWTPVAAPVHERLEDHDTTLSEAEATTALQGAPAEAKNALSSSIQGGGAVGGMALAAGLADTMRAGSGRGGLWLRRQTARALAFVGALPFKKSEAWGKAFAWANKETLASAKARAQAASENWATTKGLSLSQMMIIVGAVFLVCGGLLIGGGLLMRASSGPAVAAADPVETFSGITWLFEDPDLPLPERAVFTLSGTPRAFLINGLSIRGVNNSDEPLTGLEGVLKPDIQRPELKLSLKLDEDTHANHPSADGAESVAVAAVPKNTVPPHASFRLIFPFPAEAKGDQDGISTDELFESYGGLLLKLRYETEGTEKSVIQYLAPDLLKAQLDEVPGQVGDS